MTIAAILDGKGYAVATIGVDATVGEAIALLHDQRIGALPATRDGQIVGVISERDVVYCLKDHGAEILDWPVAEVMTAPAITVTPATGVMTALAMMTRRRIRHLPVMADGELVGIVSIGDLVKYRIDRIEAEAEAMRSYIQSA